jgi:uncharacterized protein YdcH (DUF465 family)
MEESLRLRLAAVDPDFRHLAEQHSQFEHKLAALLEKPYLSTEDQVEEVRLKKQKLWVRDQMENRCTDWARRHTAAAS